MKCISKAKLALCMAASLFLFSGCGSLENETIPISNSYDIYETSREYQLISSDDTSLQNTIPFFAAGYCISDGTDLGTEHTSSYVAEASGVFNLNTKEVTYAQNMYQKVYPASTTKILTAYLALKYGDLDEILSVSENAANQAEDSSVCHINTVDYLDAVGMPLQQVWKSTNKYLMETETAPSGIVVIGGKTGTTNDAGYCLVLLSTNSKKEQIVSIVMKADCRNNLYYYMNELLYGFAGNQH